MGKSLLVALVFLWSMTVGAVEFQLNRSLIRAQDELDIRLRFANHDEGDLYFAIWMDGKLYFYGDDGLLHEQPRALMRNQHFHFDAPGTMPLLNIPSAQGVAPNRYFLYAVVTDAGANVFDTTRWHGGEAGLARGLVEVGQNFTGDLDGDGFYDDDLGHDGFHDDDRDFDGWYDDDRNHDGERDGPPSAGDAVRGQTLYAQHCANCHGISPDSRARYQHAEEIAAAIARNKGGMGMLQGRLTLTDLRDIAAFLAR